MNHHYYTYVNQGTHGIGFSESDEIPNFSIYSLIEEALSDPRSYDSNYEFIEYLFERVERTILEDETDRRPAFQEILENQAS